MRVAFVQINCKFADKDFNINNALHHLERTSADLFVLPELFNTGYYFTSINELVNLAEPIPNGRTTDSLIAFAAQNNCFIVAGLAEQYEKHFYNSAVLIGPKGYVATYRKVHLFNEEKLWFTPGDEPFRVHDVGIAKIGMMICFDWIFPESARSLALLGADIICHPANLVLPYCQDAMVTRCIENGVFAITANRIGSETKGQHTLHFTGKSQITGPKGEILARASSDQEEVIAVEIDATLARSKALTARNDLIADRRPDMYMIKKR